MRESIHAYLAMLKSAGRSERTVSEYGNRLNYFRSNSNCRKLCNIILQDVHAFHDKLIRHKLKNSTRIAYMQTLRYFLKWAYRHGKVLVDLSANIEIPKLEETLPPTPLSYGEMKTILQLVQNSKRNRAIIELLYGCGLRKFELLALNTSDIDATACTVLVRGKGERQRLLPIGDEALEAVAQYLSGDKRNTKTAPLFVVNGQRMQGNVLSGLMERLSKKLNRHLHCHLFRHTFALHLLKGGADLAYVQALLGHESPDTTNRYLKLVNDELKAEYDRVMDEILG